jgi:hypothetical protein
MTRADARRGSGDKEARRKSCFFPRGKQKEIAAPCRGPAEVLRPSGEPGRVCAGRRGAPAAARRRCRPARPPGTHRRTRRGQLPRRPPAPPGAPSGARYGPSQQKSPPGAWRTVCGPLRASVFFRGKGPRGAGSAARSGPLRPGGAPARLRGPAGPCEASRARLRAAAGHGQRGGDPVTVTVSECLSLFASGLRLKLRSPYTSRTSYAECAPYTVSLTLTGAPCPAPGPAPR